MVPGKIHKYFGEVKSPLEKNYCPPPKKKKKKKKFLFSKFKIEKMGGGQSPPPK